MTRIFALIGPTAVGKTDVSIELAKCLDAEIVGCDSMQVYRRMRVLTQQPDAEQRSAVPHHLVDFAEPTELFNAGQYRRQAIEVIQDIQQRGKNVLLVGGTGLYLKALTDGLCDAPPADLRLREELWAAAQQKGSHVLYERLRRVDPIAAQKIHPNDARRLVRALEVFALSGKPLSSFWSQTAAETLPVVMVGLDRDRAELYDRINRRVERMIKFNGVLEEVDRLLQFPLSHTARQVHGLMFLESYLRGERPLPAAIALWQQQVRNYARRQLIWFRAEERIRWFILGPKDTVTGAVERILSELPQLTQPRPRSPVSHNS